MIGWEALTVNAVVSLPLREHQREIIGVDVHNELQAGQKIGQGCASPQLQTQPHHVDQVGAKCRHSTLPPFLSIVTKPVRHYLLRDPLAKFRLIIFARKVYRPGQLWSPSS